MRTLKQIFNDLKKKHKKDFWGISQQELLSECIEELKSENIYKRLEKAHNDTERRAYNKVNNKINKLIREIL